MSELEQALQKFPNVKGINGQYQVRCPCHNDKHASLSLSETPEGRLLAYCHAGCSFESIIKVLNLPPDGTNDIPTITNTYDYTDSEGELLYQVIRYHPKSFKQRRPDGKDWIWNLQGITPTLYKLLEVIIAIREGITVYIVEGEKDVETLRSNKLVATTISGGASTKWSPELIPLFENANIIIIPDNDAAGKKYAHYVASILDGWCASLKVLELPLGKDVSDYLQTQTIDNLLNLIHNTGEYVPRGAVTREEFESFKGVNRYLWKLIRPFNGKRKYNAYKI